MKHKVIDYRLLLVLLVVLTNSACDHSAKQVWNNGLKNCAKNDQLSKSAFYFGPSNGLGPGTVFQRFPDNSIQVAYLASSYDPTPVLAPNKPFQCATNYSSTFTLNGSVTLPSTIPVTGTVAGNVSAAKTVTVKANSLTWEELATGDYTALVNGLPATNSVKKDLLENHDLVLSRALKVSGMTAVLTFDDKAGGDAKLNIPSGPVPKDGSVGVNLTASWEGNTQLTLTSTDDFYIAGELRQYSGSGLSGPHDTIGQIVTDADSLKFVRK